MQWRARESDVTATCSTLQEANKKESEKIYFECAHVAAAAHQQSINKFAVFIAQLSVGNFSVDLKSFSRILDRFMVDATLCVKYNCAIGLINNGAMLILSDCLVDLG